MNQTENQGVQHDHRRDPMTTERRRAAARTNIRKAQAAWASMSARQHAENIEKAQAARRE